MCVTYRLIYGKVILGIWLKCYHIYKFSGTEKMCWFSKGIQYPDSPVASDWFPLTPVASLRNAHYNLETAVELISWSAVVMRRPYSQLVHSWLFDTDKWKDQLWDDARRGCCGCEKWTELRSSLMLTGRPSARTSTQMYFHSDPHDFVLLWLMISYSGVVLFIRSRLFLLSCGQYFDADRIYGLHLRL